MSDFCIYLPLDPYLSQWLIHENGGTQPVKPRRGSAESDILEVYLTKRPENVPPDIREADDTRTAIAIPDFRARTPATYNYLPKRARALLAHTIYNRFRVALWEELHRLENVGTSLTDLIYAFMEKHGIEQNETNWCTLQQMYYRKRKIYSENYRKKRLAR